MPIGKEYHAPYLAVWTAIKEARTSGCDVWDFEGIYDPRYPSTNSWLGFTHFKKSFGGEEFVYPGTFTWYINPVIKLMHRFGGFA